MPVYDKIVVLTGAGLSAESGLGTFREKGGIWSQYNLDDVATPEGFARNPDKVYEFYNMRRNIHHKAEPNKAHQALARLEHEYPGEVMMVTQNIDVLHEKAGSKNVVHMHGQIVKALCNYCGHRQDWLDGDLSQDTLCLSCQKVKGMRPDVVWFGEMPYHMENILDALEDCYLFLSIGTSGSVYPAAGFVAIARRAGSHTVELNLEPSDGAIQFHETFQGPATELVPDYVDHLLSTVEEI